VNPSPVDQFDITALLEASAPQPRIPWTWYAIGAGIFLAILNRMLAGQSAQIDAALNALCAIAMAGVLFALMAISVSGVRAVRSQHQRLDAAAEMIQLRRWPEAAMTLRHLLSEPAKTEPFRTQALVYLSVILARYDRFDDAIAVQEHLLDHERLDPGSAFGLGIGRAMAMLRQDRLFDADRAISELRRAPGACDSGGLALLEIYRDVKTGHPVEAIEIFDKKWKLLRDQLGHRVGDAWGLIARAHDLLGHEEQARQAVTNATLLTPPAELLRRYPELEKLTGRYTPAPMPAI
jgi:hypothetical protein